MEPHTSTMNENPKTQPEAPILSLPKTPLMGCNQLQLVYYQGFWCPPHISLNTLDTFRHHFHSRDNDIFIASLPKTGTTWLKALLYAIVNRATTRDRQGNHPLLTHNPHELVHVLEAGVYADEMTATDYPRPHHLDGLPSPRLFHSHLPYSVLPNSITFSPCKILYIARNPLDTLVSHWHFYPYNIKKIVGDDFEPPSIEDFFEEFCEGTIMFGPYFDHVLGYWKQSLEQPEKVLYLKYEDLKDNAIFYVKKMADFVGYPFSNDEENEGVIEEIIQLCSINNLKELEVNKSGCVLKTFEKKTLFRKGQVGDWANYFNPSMAERMKKLMEDKFQGTDLSFKFLP